MAIDFAGGGGTVNVGKGTFSPITFTDGLTLVGSGPDTIITGTIDDNTNTSLIRAYANSPGFAHPLRVQRLNLRGKALPGTRGTEVVLRDQNQSSLDTFSNNWFTLAKDSTGSVRGLYSANSYAPLVLNHNSFVHTQYGVLLETGSGSGSIFGASSITGNLFDHLQRAPNPVGFGNAIQVSVNSPGPLTAGGQDFSGNRFVYDDAENSVAFEYNGHGGTSDNGLPTLIGYHWNNLEHVDVGVLNETTGGKLSATDVFWGCSQGPDVNPAPGTGSKSCADAYGDPAITYTTPWLEGPAPLKTPGAGA